MSSSRPPHSTHAHEPTGFPSPAADSVEASLDVRDLLVKRPTATFYLRMRSNEQIASGIFAGDILVIDRSLIPPAGCLVIVTDDGVLRVTRWRLRPNAANGGAEDMHTVTLWGVVTYIIHKADVLSNDSMADTLDIE